MKTGKAGKDERRFLTVPLALAKKKEEHDMGLILGYIRLCINRNGIANPSHKNIAENVGISEKTVRRLLAKAKKGGWIDWSSGRGSHESNFYSFPASSDWLDEEEYKVDQTMVLIGQNDNDLDKPSSVKSEPSSVKSDPLIGQNDTPHRSQLRPTNIINKENKYNKESEDSISVKETEKKPKTDKLYRFLKKGNNWIFRVLSTGEEFDPQKELNIPYSEDRIVVGTYESLVYEKGETPEMWKAKLQRYPLERLEEFMNNCEYVLAKIAYQVDKGIFEDDMAQKAFELWVEFKNDIEQAIADKRT